MIKINFMNVQYTHASATISIQKNTMNTQKQICDNRRACTLHTPTLRTMTNHFFETSQHGPLLQSKQHDERETNNRAISPSYPNHSLRAMTLLHYISIPSVGTTLSPCSLPVPHPLGASPTMRHPFLPTGSGQPLG